MSKYYYVPKDDAGVYYAKFPVDYKASGVLSNEEVEEAVSFAIRAMKNTKPFSHNNKEITRNEYQIYTDILEGKLGELAIAKQAKEIGFDVEVDFNVYPLEEWDAYDLEVSRGSLSEKWQVKTSKSGSQLFLLEKNDYSDDGVYLFNGRSTIYSKFFLQRLKFSSKFINDTYKRATLNFTDVLPSETKITYEEARFLTYDELVNNIIKGNLCLEKGRCIKARADRVTKGTKLKVDNYYAQLYDMHLITELGE